MNIYVGNLSWQMTDEDLRNLFEQHGTVASAKIVKDKVSGRSKGFGFVEMEDDGEAQAAITALYDSEVMGRKIIVDLRLFTEYIIDGRYGWVVACEEAFGPGRHPVAVFHEWNSVTHLDGYEGSPEARPFSR